MTNQRASSIDRRSVIERRSCLAVNGLIHFCLFRSHPPQRWHQPANIVTFDVPSQLTSLIASLPHCRVITVDAEWRGLDVGSGALQVTLFSRGSRGNVLIFIITVIVSRVSNFCYTPDDRCVSAARRSGWRRKDAAAHGCDAPH